MALPSALTAARPTESSPSCAGYSANVRVVVLISGSGTLLQALIDDVAADAGAYSIVGVVADRAGIEGLGRARQAGIPTVVVCPSTYAVRSAWDVALADAVGGFSPDLVVSAGFMRILGPAMLSAFPVINTHPALLPSFPGAHGVREALVHGVKITGTTCHWVDSGVDTGPIIDQRAVRVEPDDDEASLHERIKVEERELLVEVVRRLAAGPDGLAGVSPMLGTV